MTQKNEAILINKFFAPPTLKEKRQGMSERDNQKIIKRMVELEDIEREYMAKVEDARYGDDSYRDNLENR